MKRLLIFVAVLASLQLLAGSGPVLKFDQTTLDLGEAEPNSKVEAVFHFVNAGDAPLEIKSVKPG